MIGYGPSLFVSSFNSFPISDPIFNSLKYITIPLNSLNELKNMMNIFNIDTLPWNKRWIEGYDYDDIIASGLSIGAYIRREERAQRT